MQMNPITEKTPQLLLVEDDINLSYLLVENLQAKGYGVTLALTGAAGINAIGKGRYDLCILDVMLPEEDGFSIAKLLRKKQPDVPFIFVTARTQEADRLTGFELGAEDYIMKPFSFKELDYRLQVILRRTKNFQPARQYPSLALGGIALDSNTRMLTVTGKESRLSQRESDLLQLLLEYKGAYITRSEILKKLWERDDFFTAKSMDVYLTRLRKLLKDEPSVEIENLYGSGYRIRLVSGHTKPHKQ